MRVLITGIGDAFTARWFGSSAIIEGPEGHVMLDCPDLVFRAMRCASETAGWTLDPATVTDVIVTHLHGDHCNGLEAFGFHRRIGRIQGRSEPCPKLHAFEPVATRVWERLAPAMDAPMQNGDRSVLADYYDLHVMPLDSSVNIGGLEVRCRCTHHPVPTIGLKISGGGWTLGWSGDTPFEAEHVEWLSSADVIVHECNLGAAHTPVEKLNALPDSIRARMRLIHLPDGFDAACTDIRALSEGEVIQGPA